MPKVLPKNRTIERNTIYTREEEEEDGSQSSTDQIEADDERLTKRDGQMIIYIYIYNTEEKTRSCS